MTNHVPRIHLWMGNLWKEWKRLRDVPEKITQKDAKLLSQEIIELIQHMKDVKSSTGEKS